MDEIYLCNVPHFKGMESIQKLYGSDTLLAVAGASFNQYMTLKLSDSLKILCRLVPRPVSSSAFGVCDTSVIQHLPNKPIDPSTVNLNIAVDKNGLEAIHVVDAKRIMVSVVFADVRDLKIWSENPVKLTEAVRNVLRLFVVRSDSVVNLKRLQREQKYNIDYILVHKTDCKNNGARTTLDTSLMIVKTMSTLQFNHVEIGLEVQPLFGMEPQVSRLKNIIKVARNGCSPLCNMVGTISFEQVSVIYLHIFICYILLDTSDRTIWHWKNTISLSCYRFFKMYPVQLRVYRFHKCRSGLY